MDADALREEMPWASRVTLDFLRKALVSFSVDATSSSDLAPLIA